ncbi:MAG TPA: glycerophosphodiester phosphodiesterase family protein [Candidatus Wallbacteria bacterium]|nr:glycerophosphodiester phosphodiesterase family protein [Candidatus Wallbacteria bacterium]
MKGQAFMFSFLILTVIFFILAIVQPVTAAEVIGHRGAAFYTPENTISSIKKALESGVDGVEIDVHLTKDGKIAVIHDKDTRRISGGAADLKVAETGWEELKKIDAGSFKSAAFAGEKIPLLEEVLAIIPADKKLFIEVKCGVEIFGVIGAVLEKSGRKGNTAIISFGLDVAAMAKIALPRCESYWIPGSKFFQGASVEDAIEIAARNNLDGLDLDYKQASASFVKKAKDAGLKFYVWTVDEPAAAAVLDSYGLDGITSNKPDVIIRKIKR